jgi:hypothetical protein
MISKKINDKIIVRIDKGEEIVETLKKVCEEHRVKLGTINGLGATDKVVIGLFNTTEKKFESKEYTGDHEITSITGNITTMNGEIYLHIHVNIADKNNDVYGGHLSSAVISGTCELFINTVDSEIDRVFDNETGLNLLKF